MRLSAKGRYALAATTSMAQSKTNEFHTLISISDRLGISKIYLEQVFSLLKRAGLVNSVKGSQGGYQLSKSPQQITVYDILYAVETTLFETVEETLSAKVPEIEAAMRYSVYEPLDDAIQTTLQKISLYDLVAEAEKNREDQSFMFFI